MWDIRARQYTAPVNDREHGQVSKRSEACGGLLRPSLWPSAPGDTVLEVGYG